MLTKLPDIENFSGPLLRPSDLDGVREIVESHSKPLYIVNSHADWDHWWGNGAFPQAPMSRSTRKWSSASMIAALRKRWSPRMQPAAGWCARS